MNSLKQLMMLYALTSTHVGSGDDLNYIDLPIQREKHTDFPKIEASSLKGSVRQSMEQTSKQTYDVNNLLGSKDNCDHGSAISFSDARLMFFPVKSAKGIFAYTTCPFAINRFISDCKIVGIDDFKDLKLDLPSREISYVVHNNVIVNNNKVILDEYIFDVKEDKNLREFIGIIKDRLPELIDNNLDARVILISDDDFKYFVTNSTEVVTRINIDSDSGVVKNKALFTQENLPPETILYSLIFFTDSKVPQNGGNSINSRGVREMFNELFPDKIFQIGGDMTLGKGLFRKKTWQGGEISDDKHE